MTKLQRAKEIKKNVEENRVTAKKSTKTYAASSILYPESLEQQKQLDEDGTTWLDRILGKGEHGLKGFTGFLSALHNRDSQRDPYTIDPQKNPYMGIHVSYTIKEEKRLKGKNKKEIIEKEKRIKFAGSMAFFVHLAGAALHGGSDVKSLSLVRKTAQFLKDSDAYNANPSLYKDDPAWFLESYTDEVLAHVTQRELDELPDNFLIDKDQHWDKEDEAKNVDLLHIPSEQMLKDHLYKKAHYHLTLITLRNKPLGLRSFLAKLQASLGKTAVTMATIQPVYTSIEQVYEYAWHHSADAIAEHKRLYDKNDIIHLAGFSLDDYIFSTKEQRLRCLNFAREIIQIIYDLKYYDANTKQLEASKYLRFICNAQDLAYYWTDKLSDAITGAWTFLISQKIKENSEEMKNLQSKILSSSNTDEDTRNVFRTRFSALKLSNARLEADLEYCEELLKALNDMTFPSDHLLFETIVSYRANFKDFFESHRQLKFELK